jgi:hypothetical protein
MRLKIVWAALVMALLCGMTMAGGGAAAGVGAAKQPAVWLSAPGAVALPEAKTAPLVANGRTDAKSAAAPVPLVPVAPVVFYNQYDSASSSGILSQNFEAAGDASDSEAADDFVVPAGKMWSISTVDVQGVQFGSGAPASFNVVFYSTNANLPAAALASRPASGFTNASGDFTITLTSTVTLGSGTYWVGVQANEDSSAGNWYWQDRTAALNQGAAWRNPGNGWATGCTAFGRKTTCVPGTGPDQVFKLSGQVIAAPDHTASLSSTDPTITDPNGRMNRNGVSSACGAQKPFPGYAGGPATYHYRTHTIRNASASPACVTITADPMTCNSTNVVFLSAYTNSFNPANLAQNYLADVGASPTSGPLAFSLVVPAGGKVVLVVSEVTANSGCPGYEFTDNAPTTAAAFGQSFDGVTSPALPAGWTAANATGPAPLWTTSSTPAPGALAPAADSPTNAAFVDDPSVVSDKILTSPSLAIRTPSAQLVFRQNRNLENLFDGGVLEISIGGGAFQDILAAGGSFETRGYNGTVSTCCTNPLAGRQAWTGNSGGFVFTTVNLPAAAAGHSVVLRWRMGSDNSVASQGWRIDSIQLRDGAALTVSKTGNGSGTVTSTPAGLNCGATCSTTFEVGTSVRLTASPAAGTTFAGWSGSGCSGTGTCTAAVNAAKSVTANFVLQSRGLTVTKAGNGAGKVTSAPAGVDCPTACSASFLYGTSVTLTAAPSAKAVFSGWSGDCSRTSTCVLSMTGNHAATATFVAKCVVPKVVGLSLKKAKAKIRKAHCRVGKITKKFSTKKKGKVLGQKPKRGKILKPGAKVNLTIGKGPKKK